MKIQCPKCHLQIPADQINVGTDLAYCPACAEAFRLSETIDADEVNADVLRDPPKGAWVRRRMHDVVVGASTRSSSAFFLVPFMCVWSGFSLGGIYGSQILEGHFDLGMSLFGIPFVLGTLLFGTIAVMTVCGKVEVHLGQNSHVFTGVGPIGWRQRFDWSRVESVREEAPRVDSEGTRQSGELVLEGPDRVRFASGLPEKRKRFLLNALKYMHLQTH